MYQSIADIYQANEQSLNELIETVSGVTDEEAQLMPDDQKWSIQQIVEHVAMVEHGISRICGRLASNARIAGKPLEGPPTPSPYFIEQSTAAASAKLEAPGHVIPTGTVKCADSLKSIKECQTAFEAIRTDLETYDVSEPTFPHPYFGPLTAIDWLILAGGHQKRHNQQIRRILVSLRKQ